MTGTTYIPSTDITVGDILYVAVTLRDVKHLLEFYVPVEVINIIKHATLKTRFEVHFLSGDSGHHSTISSHN